MSVCEADGRELDRVFDGPPLIDGKYELLRALGGGGMGVVYLAYHRGLQREVALKIIKPTRHGSEFLTRFRAEAMALGRLRHPHIVNVTDYGVDARGSGMPYLVMEHLAGVPLDRALQTGAMSIRDALPLLAATASAIDFAHQQGVLHRDIKPENVFLSRIGNAPPAVKVVDFGVARIGDPPSAGTLRNVEVRASSRRPPDSKRAERISEDSTRLVSSEGSISMHAVSPSLTTPGEILGTLPYLAPELLAGDSASIASDVYAFGVLAYQVLVGRRPNDIRNLESATYEEPPDAHTLNATLTPEISRVLAWPLRRYASDRPTSATEFVDALRRAHQQSLVQSWKRTELPRRRRLAAIAALLLCAAAWQGHTGAWGGAIEDRLIDTRVRLVPSRAPDPRIVVVLVDDASLAESAELLGERADEFSERFEMMFAAGASGVAVDLLLPERWSRSQRFSKFVLNHADRLALAALSGPAGRVVGPECVSGLTAAALGPQRASSLFGFVNIEPDADGVTRRARPFFVDANGARRDSFALRAIRAGLGENAVTAVPRRMAEASDDRFLIDGRVDHQRFSTMSWGQTADELSRNTSVFRDRVVFVGASFVGSSDLHRLSGQGPIAGVFVQALLADTVLKGLPIRQVTVAAWLPAVFIMSWLAGVHGGSDGPFAILMRTLAIGCTWVTGAFAAFAVAGWILPVLVPVVTIVSAGLAAGLIRPFLRPYPRPEGALA